MKNATTAAVAALLISQHALAQDTATFGAGSLQVCNYCIEARELYVPGNGGTRLDLTWNMFAPAAEQRSKGGVVITGNEWQIDARPAGDVPVLVPTADMDLFYLGRNDYGSVAIPVIKQRTNDRFKVRTDSVCVGSQFRPSPFYFVAPDGHLMASPRYVLHSPARSPIHDEVSKFASDFPPGGPIVCEGELVPLKQLYRAVLKSQISEVLQDFARRTDDKALQQAVEAATRVIVVEHLPEISALVLDRVEQAPAQRKNSAAVTSPAPQRR